MRTTGFICEFNPLHDGHRFFIENARKTTGADRLIALMSGDWVQRGEPAVLPMHERARAALEAGADLILQLPDAFACASAQYFAGGGVRLLDALGCVDSLSFGAECGDSALLETLSAFLYGRDSDIQPLIRQHVSGGMTYAQARSQAVTEVLAGSDGCSDLPAADSARIVELLKKPNNQLALAYMQALLETGSLIRPCPVRRDPAFESSSEIRRRIMSGDPSCQKYLCADDFSLVLKDRLLRLSAPELTAFSDVSPDLANRIKNRQNEFVSWSQFTDLLHTKEMTRARISRCLCHIILGIRKDDPLLDARRDEAHRAESLTRPDFIRILGFKKDAGPLLARLKECSAIPLVTNIPSDVSDYPGDLYRSVLTEKYSVPFTESHTIPVVVI